jgi:hypothetical protein
VRFEEVVVQRPREEERRESESIELVLRSGHVVRLSAHFDATALRRLLDVLDEMQGAC